MAPVVRYGGGDNSVLRLVLYGLWKMRCYWCDRPKDFNDIHIDHILPRHAGAKHLGELRKKYDLPDDFDIDDPQNLAPICSVCNGPRHKGKKEYGAKAIVLDHLDRARELRPKVIEQVLNFGSSKRIAEHLLRVGEADLSDPKARRAFEEYAPGIVQKLALLDEKKADFVTFGTEAVEVDHELILEVGLSLDGRVIIDMRVDVDSIDFERQAPSLEFTFSGAFDVFLSAGLVQDGRDGIGLHEAQGDMQVVGTFSFGVAWYFSSEPGDVETSECRIKSWETDIGSLCSAG